MKTFTFDPITREQIKDYCQASGDWNKIHHDEAFAKEAGLPSVIAHGMLSMGLLGRALAEWGFDMSKLKNYEAKFKDIVLPGDVLTAQILKEEAQADGTNFDLQVVNQKGIEILSARVKYS